jgi:hypothetical protein
MNMRPFEKEIKIAVPDSWTSVLRSFFVEKYQADVVLIGETKMRITHFRKDCGHRAAKIPLFLMMPYAAVTITALEDRLQVVIEYRKQLLIFFFLGFLFCLLVGGTSSFEDLFSIVRILAVSLFTLPFILIGAMNVYLVSGQRMAWQIKRELKRECQAE